MGKQLVMNLFASGKCVLTGAKSYAELKDLFDAFQRSVCPDVFW